MSSEIKQALKQLRKTLNEQREYEMFLRTESAHRVGALMEKLLPLMPLFMSKFGLSANAATSAQASQILLLTKLILSLTDDQVAAIQEHLSVEQKKHLLELLHSIPGASHTASSSTSRETSPSAAQAAARTTTDEPAAEPPKAPVRHWFYPNCAIGCGLNIDGLRANELSCVRHEVTCSGCLAQLHADQEKNQTRVKADAAAGGQG